MSAELFRAMAGLEWTHVHYRGSGPGVVDLSSGHVHAMFDNIASSLELLRSGKVRALAVTTREPSEVMPNLPPIWTVLPGYETAGFYGAAVPRGTPQEIVALLNREINLAIADPVIRKQFSGDPGHSDHLQRPRLRRRVRRRDHPLASARGALPRP